MTLNEEKNLPRCLESVRGLAAEIVVVDSGSTDRTCAVAESFGAHVLYHPWPGNIPQMQRTADAASQPWVLFLDADEALSPELALAIRKRFSQGTPAENGFWVNRRTWYLGDWVWHAWYPEWRLRLVKKEHARWS